MLLPDSITNFEKVLIELGFGNITPNDDVSVIVSIFDKKIILPTSMLASICVLCLEVAKDEKYNDFFKSTGPYVSNKALLDSFYNLVYSESCLRNEASKDADAEDDTDEEADQDADQDSDESYEVQDAEGDSDQDEGDAVEKVD